MELPLQSVIKATKRQNIRDTILEHEDHLAQGLVQDFLKTKNDVWDECESRIHMQHLWIHWQKCTDRH